MRFRTRYGTESVLQIRRPDNTLCFEHYERFSKNYRLYKGKVYRKDADETPFHFEFGGRLLTGAPLNGFEVIEHYPLKDLYPTFVQFMEEY